MPSLFTPFTLKDVTLRNRIVMSPMTMYSSIDGRLDDYHVSYLGARAAGGFALVFGEQMAITPDGRTTTSCAGLWDDAQIEGHARVADVGACARRDHDGTCRAGRADVRRLFRRLGRRRCQRR
jgi:2,4-dienoyl-CoA reductase-like NADH-dependent reductase (Old Yellow Enzyme family)